MNFERKEGIMDKIGYGLIGGGLWGETHARVISLHPFATLVAVCDVVEERAQQMAEKYGAKAYYTDYQEMLKNPDIQAVGIVTPDFAHCAPFIAAC